MMASDSPRATSSETPLSTPPVGAGAGVVTLGDIGKFQEQIRWHHSFSCMYQ